VELNCQNNGERVRNSRQKRQAVQRTLPQPSQGRHLQVKVDPPRGKPTNPAPLLAWQSVGHDFKIDTRQVKLFWCRSENCVKNMLYSRMRRSVRLLNRFIFLNYRKQLKEINISFIYRLIDFTEKSYKKTENSRNEQENISIRNSTLTQASRTRSSCLTTTRRLHSPRNTKMTSNNSLKTSTSSKGSISATEATPTPKRPNVSSNPKMPIPVTTPTKRTTSSRKKDQLPPTSISSRKSTSRLKRPYSCKMLERVQTIVSSSKEWTNWTA